MAVTVSQPFLVLWWLWDIMQVFYRQVIYRQKYCRGILWIILLLSSGYFLLTELALWVLELEYRGKSLSMANYNNYMCSSSLLLVTTAPTPQGSCIRQVYALKLYGFHLLFHIVCSRRKFLSSFALTKDTVVVIFCKDGVEHLFFKTLMYSIVFFIYFIQVLNYIRIQSWIFYLGGYNWLCFILWLSAFILGSFASWLCCLFDSLIVFISYSQFSLFPAFFLTLRNTQAYVFLGSFLRLPICSIDVWWFNLFCKSRAK